MLLQSLRRTRRAPGFALAVLLLITVVVAINGTIFSAWWGLTHTPLPYADETRLAELRIELRDIQFQVSLAPRLLHALRGQTGHFDGLIGFPDAGSTQNDASGQEWKIQRITHDFNAVLGVAPTVGRSFDASEAVEGAPPAVLISARMWQQRFAAAPDVVGRELRIADRALRIVGVMPPAFAFPDTTVDAWMPYIPGAAERAQDSQGGFGDFTVAARLAGSTTTAQAASALQNVLNDDPGMAGLMSKPGNVVGNVRPWRARFGGDNARVLGMLQLAALLLALAVAANLINLAFDRCVAREREFAICRALGGRRSDTLRAVLVELLPPVLGGAVLGLLLVPAGIAWLQSRAVLPAGFPGAVGLDWTGALLLLALIAALLLGTLLAVLHARLLEPTNTPFGQRAPAGGLGRARSGMLIVQIGLSTVLLGGSGLLLHSAWKLLSAERGFDARGVVLTSIDLIGATRSQSAEPAAALPSVAELQSEIAALPGVNRVAIADMTPFSGSEFISSVQLDGQAESHEVRSPTVGPGYFAALGTPLLAGREFTLADRGTASPVIVDTLFQQRWLGGRSGVGSTLRIGEGKDSRLATIVGVVPIAKFQKLDERPDRPTLYQLLDDPGALFFLLTHTSGDPAKLLRAIRERVLRLAPGALMAFNRPLEALIGQSLTSRRALLEAVAIFAGLTLLLTAAGLYAVLSVSVRRRTAELGVRLALGATTRRVQRLILWQATALIAGGVLLGLLAGLPLARLLEAQLHGVSAGDPLTWVASSSVVALAALLACWWPARRATRIAPARALNVSSA